MLTSKWVIAAALSGLLASASYAGCSKPAAAPTQFPDGSSADLDTMLAAKKQVDNYLKSAQAYINCVDSDEAAALKKMKENKDMDKDARAAEIGKLDTARKSRNAVVDQMKSTGDAFNAEIKKYQAKHN